MLVKLDARDPTVQPRGASVTTASFLKDVPAIPEAQLQNVFRHRLNWHPAPDFPSSGRAMPVENAAFMAHFGERELAHRAEQESGGELIGAAQLASEMKVRQQAISKAVQEKRMFYLNGPAGRYLYPAFFASPNLDRRQVQRVSRALGDLPGAGKWQFFTTPRVSLGGRTALEALQQGELDRVLVAAAATMES